MNTAIMIFTFMLANGEMQEFETHNVSIKECVRIAKYHTHFPRNDNLISVSCITDKGEQYKYYTY